MNFFLSFLDFQSCATTYPYPTLAYLILGAIGAGTGYYIGDHFYGGNSTDFMNALNDSTIVGDFYSEPISNDSRKLLWSHDNNIASDNTLDWVLLGFGVTIVLAIMALVVLKVRKSQRNRSDYESI